ncbi:MAG: septum formation initiator family protein [Succinivibrionaceae bacterium]|nr:septum formation initiator family protein [Succinivibrionaceae bacterium]
MLSRVMTLVLVAIIAYLAYDLIYGRNGMLQYEETAEQLGSTRQKSEQLRRRNEQLRDELNDLRQGNATVEELARGELGLIKEGETFYRVIDSKAGEGQGTP